MCAGHAGMRHGISPGLCGHVAEGLVAEAVNAGPAADAFHAHLKRIAVRQLTDLDRDDIDNRLVAYTH